MGLQQGLYVTVIGMGLVFMALLVVMAVALLSERLLRAKPQSEAESPQGHANDQADEEELRTAAVIAAALTVLDHEAQVQALARLPESVLTLEHVSQGWKAAGRLGSMH